MSIKIMLCLFCTVACLLAMTCATDRASDSAYSAADHPTDRCPRSSALVTGPGKEWYSTIAPCEAFESARTHTFPHTCNVQELIKSSSVIVQKRTIKGLPGIYNVVTRDRNELFVLGGCTKSTDECEDDGEACATGPYVAKINASTLQVVWKTQIHNAKKNRDWDYPGAIGVHGNGYVYAICGYHLAKIDPFQGTILRLLKLPVPDGREPGDTVYNGFSILADGKLIAKSMTRKAGSQADSIRALLFHYDNNVRSIITVVEPDRLELISSIEAEEPVLGRITNNVFNQTEYIYVAGLKKLFRYIYRNNKITVDKTWGPVIYCRDGQKPSTAPVVFGDFVLVQTNFQLASGAISLLAVAQSDAGKMFRIVPFEEDRLLPGSLQWSLPTVDVENGRIYSYDALENKLAAINFDKDKGFSIAWKTKQRSLSFAVIAGPKNKRVLVLDDLNLPTLSTVNVIWRDAGTGEKLASSPLLPQGAGLPVTPGFDGVMYYPSHNGMLTELSLIEKNQDRIPKR